RPQPPSPFAAGCAEHPAESERNRSPTSRRSKPAPPTGRAPGALAPPCNQPTREQPAASRASSSSASRRRQKLIEQAAGRVSTEVGACRRAKPARSRSWGLDVGRGSGPHVGGSTQQIYDYGAKQVTVGSPLADCVH